MPAWIYLFLFLFGAAIGSFLNVVILRYKPEGRILKSVGGRSHCPHCNRTLRWYELIPLLSFAFQRGRCRSCYARLTWQYPLVEFLSGAVLVLVPWMTIKTNPGILLYLFGSLSRFSVISHALYASLHTAALGNALLAVLWIVAFLTLIVIAAIDLRLKIIPDEMNLFLAALGIGAVLIKYFFHIFAFSGGKAVGSFLGPYATMFGFTGDVWINALIGTAFVVLLLALLHFGSRGRAMGFGDVKFAVGFGLLMGWPDAGVALMLAFIVGSIISLFLLAIGKGRMKSKLPFAPFIVAGITLVYFFGYDIINGYFRLFGLHI
ncbi:MAG: prepilin peptidase [Patescibacteria group bacterium]|nr:prepilin peptidase [Patescibacteria group bacterium]